MTTLARAISATCSEAMDYSDNPALIVNPAAGVRDLVAWLFVEIAQLHAQLQMVACSKSDVETPIEDLAEMICTRLEPIRAVLGVANGRA